MEQEHFGTLLARLRELAPLDDAADFPTVINLVALRFVDPNAVLAFLQVDEYRRQTIDTAKAMRQLRSGNGE